MKAIILAGGYATRLYPLTVNKPKHLLEINGKTIIDYICDDIDKIEEVDEIIVVTNHKFASNFEQWGKERDAKKPIKVIDDGTTSNEDRLGAIGDINLVIENEKIKDDVMILAGDSFYTESLVKFYDYYKTIDNSCLIARRVDDLEFLKRCGVVKLDRNNKITDFEEKPLLPKSNYIGFLMYILKRDSVELLKDYVAEGNAMDNAGSFIAWLYPKKDVYGYVYNGEFYDIGTVDYYKEVKERFESGKEKKQA